jgi:hypothetical protein
MMSFTTPINKGKYIQCPAIRYLFYVIANTLQARNEFTRLNDEDILVLAKAAIPNNNVSLNLGAVLVRYLEFQSNVSQGPLTCGGVITVLATAMGIDLSNLQPLLGERRVGFSTLKACKMLTRRGGVYYVHIAGARRLYPAPLPHGLFSIEEGRLLYDVQVEQHQPEEEIPEEDEDQEEEQGVPEQEEQPPSQFVSYQDFHALGGTIEGMHNLALSLQATTNDLSSRFSDWSNNLFPPPQ